jgi:hypothetical protein
MRRLVLVTLLLAILAAGCRSADQTIEWDLSGRPTPEQIGWASRFDDIWNVTDVGEFRLVLENRTVVFHDVHDLNADAFRSDGEYLDFVRIDFNPESGADARDRVLDLAADWDLDPDPVSGWRAGGDGGVLNPEVGLGPTDARPLNEHGLVVGVSTRTSSHPQTRVIVSFWLNWPVQGEGGDTLGP